MTYRICKQFEIATGHALSKHKGKCIRLHGHTRTVEVVVVADKLDANDMVCDFTVLKKSVGGVVNMYDHALMLNSNDPLCGAISAVRAEGLIALENVDPTTEIIAEKIFREIEGVLPVDEKRNVKIERVRIWESSSSWAEFSY